MTVDMSSRAVTVPIGEHDVVKEERAQYGRRESE